MSGSKDCPEDYLWYTCSEGDYAGCCASDPCHNSGICPSEDSLPEEDETETEDLPETTSESSAEPTVTFETITLDPATLTLTVSTSTSESTTSSNSRPDSTEATATTTAAEASGTSDVPPQLGEDDGDSKGPLIGGLVGGVIAILLLAILIIFLIIRKRRRKSGLHSSLVRWQAARRSGDPPAPMGDMYAGVSEKRDGENSDPSNDQTTIMMERGGFYNSVSNKTASTMQSESSFPSDRSTVVGSPGLCNHSVYASTSSPHSHRQSDSSQPGLIPLHTLNESPSSQRGKGAYDRTELSASVPVPSSAALSRTSYTSRDGDADNRRCSELCADLPRDLTNVPAPQRSYTPAHSPEGSQHAVPPLTVTTPDGAVLQPNLNIRPEDPGGQRRRSHVMSFMQYPDEPADSGNS